MLAGFKTAVVTGAAGGLGRAICRRLATDGYTLILCDIDPVVHDFRDALADEGAIAFSRIHDVSKEEDWEILKAYLEEDLGSISTLICSSGFNGRLSIMNGTKNDWNRTFEVNVFGVFLGLRTLAPLMRDVEGASVVNISSSAAMIGDTAAAYSASKWAVRGLTKAAAIEFAQWGIRVNSVHPGTVPTPMLRNAPPGHSQAWHSMIPMSRSGMPDEIAGVVSFLAGKDSSYMTGADLVVDGGLTQGGLSTARHRLLTRTSSSDGSRR